jgi:hypothetical protein
MNAQHEIQDRVDELRATVRFIEHWDSLQVTLGVLPTRSERRIRVADELNIDSALAARVLDLQVDHLFRLAEFKVELEEAEQHQRTSL